MLEGFGGKLRLQVPKGTSRLPSLSYCLDPLARTPPFPLFLPCLDPSCPLSRLFSEIEAARAGRSVQVTLADLPRHSRPTSCRSALPLGLFDRADQPRADLHFLRAPPAGRQRLGCAHPPSHCLAFSFLVVSTGVCRPNQLFFPLSMSRTVVAVPVV